MAARSARSCSNLPCHPPHAVTCLDGFPLTKQGKGGTALGITIIAAFIGASFGITEMIFLAPFLVKVALEFGPAEVCSLMLVGLLAGSTLAKGSPLKGVAMTVLGLLIGIVGSDIETGQPRFTFGITELFDGRRDHRAGARDVRHRRVHEQHQQYRNGRHEIRQGWHLRHVSVEGGPQAGVLADDPRHRSRQPLRADSRHRPDHRFVRVLRHREEDLENAGAFRPRRDRGCRMPGSFDALLGAGRLHPDDEPRAFPATR